MQVIVRILFRRFIKEDFERENIILRRENGILKRRQKSPNITDIDRFFFIAIYRNCRDCLENIAIVKPSTVVGWHRKLAAKKWDYSKIKVGRPPVTEKEKRIVIEIKRENPSWGSWKIKGRLKKLGIKLCRTTIKKILRENGFPPDKKKSKKRDISWFKLIKSQYKRFWSCDFFTVETLFFQRIYVFFIIEYPSRKLIHFGVTRSPKQKWLEQIFIEAIEKCDEIPELVITDRDGIYGKWLKEFLRDWFDIKHNRTPPACPFFNPYAERMARTFKEEAFDHLIVYNSKDVKNILIELFAYYNVLRPHSSLDFDAPSTKFSSTIKFDFQKVRRQKILDGIITEFDLAA